MTDEHAFCRIMLRNVMQTVRERTTPAQRKAAWAWRYVDSHDNIEFHGPGDFYWHGRGCCKWIARANGWQAWLDTRSTSC